MRELPSSYSRYRTFVSRLTALLRLLTRRIALANLRHEGRKEDDEEVFPFHRPTIYSLNFDWHTETKFTRARSNALHT